LVDPDPKDIGISGEGIKFESQKITLLPVLNGIVWVGISLPFNFKRTFRFNLNLDKMNLMEKLILHQESEEDTKVGNRLWRIAKAYDDINRLFLQSNATHVLFMGFDEDIPQDTINILLKYNADVVSQGKDFIFVKKNVLMRYAFLNGMKLDGRIKCEKLFLRWVRKQKDLKLVELDNIIYVVHYSYEDQLYYEEHPYEKK
jgi:hypothetical protein